MSRVSLLALALLPVAACSGGRPASHPDQAAVMAAQSAWCDSLARVHGAGAWEHEAACKAAKPTASAAYLRGMTKCYASRIEGLGEQAPDNQQVVTDCNDEVTVSLPDDAVVGREVIGARCERMHRCEKIEIAECKSAVERLETAQRAIFTVTYNAAALHDIAECLGDSACTENEEAARDACYKPAGDKLLWFPG